MQLPLKLKVCILNVIDEGVSFSTCYNKLFQVCLGVDLIINLIAGQLPLTMGVKVGIVLGIVGLLILIVVGVLVTICIKLL